MRKGILGKKVGMTRIFDKNGHAIPVTVVEAGPCQVIQKKTAEHDGYDAVQLAFGACKERKVTRPVKGHYVRAGAKPRRYLREFRLENIQDYAVGQEITAAIFSDGEYVDVVGTSKGKGFAGGIKRWGFKRGPMAHGSKYHRGPGSLQSRDASRVFPGRKLPGRMGGARVTAQGLKIVRVDANRNMLLIKGAVPGNRGSLLVIKDSVKAKGKS
ncbi:MAG: 50S ribosomal protein L3 [Bacillota bacterium]